MWRKEGNNCFRVLPLFVHNYCTVTIDPAPWQETAFVVACCKIAQKGEFNSENSPYFRNNINKALLKLKSGLALSIYAEHVFQFGQQNSNGIFFLLMHWLMPQLIRYKPYIMIQKLCENINYVFAYWFRIENLKRGGGERLRL